MCVRWFARSCVLVSAGVFVAPTFAQTTVDCHWQVSLDSGVTWQTGNILAPQSQTSVWVRAVTTVRESGVAVPSGNSPNLTLAMMEGWSTTVVPTGDVVSGVSWLSRSSTTTPLPAPFAWSGFASRRAGNILFADRSGDTTAPGLGVGILVENYPGGSPGLQPWRINPLPIFAMSVNLDGSVGDRVFSGAFVGFSSFNQVVPNGHVETGNPGVPSGWAVTPVTQFPVTLTIVPSPGGAAVVVGGVMLALRRRRG